MCGSVYMGDAPISAEGHGRRPTERIAVMDSPRISQCHFVGGATARETPGHCSVCVMDLWAAWQDMLAESRFEVVEVTGRYSYNPVVLVIFAPAGAPPAMVTEQNLTIFRQPLQGPASAVAIGGVKSGKGISFNVDRTSVGADKTSLANDGLSAQVDYLGKVVPRRDIWVMVVWLILNAAPRILDELSVFRVMIAMGSDEVRTVWNPVRPAPGTHPYMMSYADLISLVADLPFALLRGKKFYEMNIAVKDNGIVIARGLFRTKPKPRSVLDGPASNVTESS